MAKARGWGYFQTENGATFRPDILARFDAVVFNNVSGDVFDAGQRAALRAFVERGGGFVAIHGSGGDGEYDWKWYGETLIGAKFIGHPMFPQFQQAVVRVDNGSHPATRSLPETWIQSDEWYSFARSPRLDGANVLLTVDERTYPNRKTFGIDLSMGADHPVAWWHCMGRGRALYSALGHAAEAYDEPGYRAMLEGAVSWALRLDGAGCDGEKAETGR